jgi:putative glutamine amidotransferase
MARPLIGVTAEFAEIDIHDTRMPAYVGTTPYVRAVRKAGGVPVILPITTDPEAAALMADRVDGVVISGGLDIDPGAYGQEPVEEVSETQVDRDSFEFELIRALVERNLPTLAICRGIQSVNVALGGGLVQHIDGHMRNDLYNDTAHHALIEADSRLASVVGTTTLEVNSLHHQVVDDLADGCVVIARDDDGNIEALAVDGADRVLAVQWHPELLRHRAPHLALFQALCADASA